MSPIFPNEDIENDEGNGEEEDHNTNQNGGERKDIMFMLNSGKFEF